eukprot:7255578-Pyramimonas_sp.AAC.1
MLRVRGRSTRAEKEGGAGMLARGRSVLGRDGRNGCLEGGLASSRGGAGGQVRLACRFAHVAEVVDGAA